MNFWSVPWVEITVALPLVGAICVSRIRDPMRTYRGSLAFTGAALVGAFLTCIGFYLGVTPDDAYSLQPYLFRRRLFQVDELGAPLLALVALMHFLTALATGRTKMRRFSFAWSLTSETLRLAAFACQQPWVLIALISFGTVPAYFELLNRRKPTRVYLIHMGLFVVLLVVGWTFVVPDGHHQTQTAWATIPLLAAILIRCGAVPAHCWITDWFEHASFGNAILFVTPLAGVYLAVRLVLPIAPDWILNGIGVVSLFTAVYAAGMACVQRDARRFYAHLFISHASLVLVGLQLVTSISLTGALCLWFSVTLALGGLGLTLRALEARVGRITLVHFHGLYESSPALAVCFLVTGLASVGFPGTLGFVATELLVDGAVDANPYIGLGVVLSAALNGIAVVRAYLLIFTGTRHASNVSLSIGLSERIAVLTLASLIFVGGVLPQFGVTSRYRAAEKILEERKTRGTAQAAIAEEEQQENITVNWD